MTDNLIHLPNGTTRKHPVFRKFKRNIIKERKSSKPEKVDNKEQKRDEKFLQKLIELRATAPNVVGLPMRLFPITQ